MKKKLFVMLIVIAFAALSFGLLGCGGLSDEANNFVAAVNNLPPVVSITLEHESAVNAADALWANVPSSCREDDTVADARTRLDAKLLRIAELRGQGNVTTPELSAAANAFINAVNALPTVANLTLANADAVMNAHNVIWAAVPTGERTVATVAASRNTLNDLVNRITELQQQVGLSAAANEFINAVNALPNVNSLTIANEVAVNTASGLWGAVPQTEWYVSEVAAARTTLDGLVSRMATLLAQAALRPYQDAAIADLEAMFALYFDITDYLPADWSAIETIKENVRNAILATTTFGELGLFVNHFIGSVFYDQLFAVPTEAQRQYAADLAEAIDALVVLVNQRAYILRNTQVLPAEPAFGSTFTAEFDYFVAAFDAAIAEFITRDVLTITNLAAAQNTDAATIDAWIIGYVTTAMNASQVRLTAYIETIVVQLIDWFNLRFNSTTYAAAWGALVLARDGQIGSLRAIDLFIDTVDALQAAQADIEAVVGADDYTLEALAVLNAEFASRFIQTNYLADDWAILQNLLNNEVARVMAMNQAQAEAFVIAPNTNWTPFNNVINIAQHIAQARAAAVARFNAAFNASDYSNESLYTAAGWLQIIYFRDWHIANINEMGLYDARNFGFYGVNLSNFTTVQTYAQLRTAALTSVLDGINLFFTSNFVSNNYFATEWVILEGLLADRIADINALSLAQLESFTANWAAFNAVQTAVQVVEAAIAALPATPTDYAAALVLLAEVNALNSQLDSRGLSISTASASTLAEFVNAIATLRQAAVRDQLIAIANAAVGSDFLVYVNLLETSKTSFDVLAAADQTALQSYLNAAIARVVELINAEIAELYAMFDVSRADLIALVRADLLTITGNMTDGVLWTRIATAFVHYQELTSITNASLATIMSNYGLAWAIINALDQISTLHSGGFRAEFNAQEWALAQIPFNALIAEVTDVVSITALNSIDIVTRLQAIVDTYAGTIDGTFRFTQEQVNSLFTTTTFPYINFGGGGTFTPPAYNGHFGVWRLDGDGELNTRQLVAADANLQNDDFLVDYLLIRGYRQEFCNDTLTHLSSVYQGSLQLRWRWVRDIDGNIVYPFRGYFYTYVLDNPTPLNAAWGLGTYAGGHGSTNRGMSLAEGHVPSYRILRRLFGTDIWGGGGVFMPEASREDSFSITAAIMTRCDGANLSPASAPFRNNIGNWTATAPEFYRNAHADRWGGRVTSLVAQANDFIAGVNAIGTLVYTDIATGNASLARIAEARRLYGLLNQGHAPQMALVAAARADMIAAEVEFDRLEGLLVDQFNGLVTAIGIASIADVATSITNTAQATHFLPLAMTAQNRYLTVLSRTQSVIAGTTQRLLLTAILNAIDSLDDIGATGHELIAAVDELSATTTTFVWPGFRAVAGVDSWNDIATIQGIVERLGTEPSGGWHSDVASALSTFNTIVAEYYAYAAANRQQLVGEGQVNSGGTSIFRPARPDFDAGYFEYSRGASGVQFTDINNRNYIQGIQVFIFGDDRPGAIPAVLADYNNAIGYFWIIWGSNHGLSTNRYVVGSDFFISGTATRDPAFPSDRIHAMPAGDWNGAGFSRSGPLERIMTYEISSFDSGVFTARFAGRLVAVCSTINARVPFSTGGMSTLSDFAWNIRHTA